MYRAWQEALREIAQPVCQSLRNPQPYAAREGGNPKPYTVYAVREGGSDVPGVHGDWLFYVSSVAKIKSGECKDVVFDKQDDNAFGVLETSLYIVSRRVIARKQLLSLTRGLRAAREGGSNVPGVAGACKPTPQTPNHTRYTLHHSPSRPIPLGALY